MTYFALWVVPSLFGLLYVVYYDLFGLLYVVYYDLFGLIYVVYYERVLW